MSHNKDRHQNVSLTDPTPSYSTAYFAPNMPPITPGTPGCNHPKLPRPIRSDILCRGISFLLSFDRDVSSAVSARHDATNWGADRSMPSFSCCATFGIPAIPRVFKENRRIGFDNRREYDHLTGAREIFSAVVRHNLCRHCGNFKQI